MDLKINEIHLGDAYELIKAIPDQSIDCVYTDIPYDFVGNMKNGGGGLFGTKKRDYHGEYEQVAKRNDVTGVALRTAKGINETKEIAFGINYTILEEMVRVMKKVNIFIWCSKKQLLPIMQFFDKDNIYFELLVWGKTNPIPTGNNKWLPDLEYCLYFRESGVLLNDGYELKSKFHVSSLNKSDKDQYNHPTIKPLELVKRHLKHATPMGALILDPFIGSGTTAVASQEIGRKFIGFEINDEYHKIATERLMGIDQQGQISIFADFQKIEEMED